MKQLYTFLFLLGTLYTYAQVGIGTEIPDPSAQLEISSTDKGLLIPRVTQANRPGSPGKPAAKAGLMIYQTDNDPGFYTFDGTQWEKMVKASEVTPRGFAFLTSSFPENYVFTATPVQGTDVPLSLTASTPDFISQDPTSVTVLKAGTYSVEYSITPISVTGNQYQVLLQTGNESVKTLVRGSVQISNPGKVSLNGQHIIYIPAQRRISLQLQSYPNTNLSYLTFGRANYDHAVSLKITRLL